MRVVVENRGAVALKMVEDVHRRRLPCVAHIRLVRHARRRTRDPRTGLLTPFSASLTFPATNAGISAFTSDAMSMKRVR